jgi:hypothetical protein
VVNASIDRSSIDDAQALDLIGASGVLNPDLTLDKLMDVTRQLAELQPATEGSDLTINVFIHRFYCLRHLPFPVDAGASA